MSALNGFQAVLFDMDGVVLDSMAQHAGLWQELFAQRGFEVPKSYILENEGSLGPEALLNFLASQGQGPKAGLDEMQALLDQQAALYIQRHASRVRPFPLAGPLLGALAQRQVPTALVTSSRREVVTSCLDESLRGRFQALITASDVRMHKPHPEPYLTAARTLGVDPKSCLVIENAPAGIDSALAAGATCYAVCSTLEPVHLQKAHQVFAGLGELAQALGLIQV